MDEALKYLGGVLSIRLQAAPRMGARKGRRGLFGKRVLPPGKPQALEFRTLIERVFVWVEIS